jgi:histidine triad (HIT) family protein
MEKGFTMCLFCKLVNGEIPSNKVLEDDNFIAFHDINPIAPVHILIIPKVHVEKFQDVQPEMMAGMTTFIQSVTKKMGLDNNGYRLVTNNGEDGGQEVPHLHFHLLGGARLKWTHLHDETPKASM